MILDIGAPFKTLGRRQIAPRNLGLITEWSDTHFVGFYEVYSPYSSFALGHFILPSLQAKRSPSQVMPDKPPVLSRQVEAYLQSVTDDFPLPHNRNVKSPLPGESVDSAGQDKSLFFTFASRSSAVPAKSLPPEIGAVLEEFAQGLPTAGPTASAIVSTARSIARTAAELLDSPEISVDVDGAISFDLLLPNGNLLMAELAPSGWLDGSIYDADGNLLERLRKATGEIIVSAIRENTGDARS